MIAAVVIHWNDKLQNISARAAEPEDHLLRLPQFVSANKDDPPLHMSELSAVFMAATLCQLVAGSPPGSPISGRLPPVQVRRQILRHGMTVFEEVIEMHARALLQNVGSVRRLVADRGYDANHLRCFLANAPN